MLALMSVWLALASLLIALGMLVYRPAFTDVTALLVLYFGVPGALCLAGLTLWAHRRQDDDPGLAARRLQCKVAIVFGVLAGAIVYGLVIFSKKIVAGA